MSEDIKTIVKDNVRLRIMNDTDPQSPRDWDNLGKMVCWHNRYNLGDEQPTEDPEDFLKELGDKIVILPLFLYDHSGITMKTSAFNCRWDSGQVGYIYATNEDIIKEYGDVTEKTIEKVKKILDAEVKTYDQYLTGDVYGFILEEKNQCESCKNIEWKNIDSCWGFFGMDHLKESLKDQLEEKYHSLIDEI